MKAFLLNISIATLLFCACNSQKQEKIVAPWGEVIEENDTASFSSNASLSIKDIVSCGELILLTENGPQTYFDYHGHSLGTQYLIVERFAEKIGVKVRVEVCKDSAEIVNRLNNHEGDIAAFLTPGDLRGATPEMQDSIKLWYTSKLLADVQQEEKNMFSLNYVKRKVYSPFINRSGGIISQWDPYFKKYSSIPRWDWRLVAAQCYQESCFDPQAKSWAGACGLMQIMPSTAAHLNLSQSQIFSPEDNIAAACRYLRELSNLFQDIPSLTDKQNFILAAYNGGYLHIRDAMALAKSKGFSAKRWSEVAPFVLLLMRPEGYRNPIVKYGYMRGEESVDYVERIRQRYANYCGGHYRPAKTYSVPNISSSSTSSSISTTAQPQKAKKKSRFKIY